MKAFDDEDVELAAYQLRDVAGAWFEMWEKERDENDGSPTWEEFEEAFMSSFIPKGDREAKVIEFEQLKQWNKSVQEYYIEFIRLAKHAPHMVKTEKAKIRRFVGGLAYHIKDTILNVAVGMTTFSSIVGFAKHLEKDIQQRREEKKHNKKARTTGRFNGTSSGGGRDSSNKDSLAPAQSSHQSGGGYFFRRTQSYGNHLSRIRILGHHPHIARVMLRNIHTNKVFVEHVSGNIQTGYGAGRGADRVTPEGGQPRLFATLDRQSAEASAEVITNIILVCSHNAYAIMDPGSTFSYVTSYFAINLGLEPEQLSEPFLAQQMVSKGCLAYLAHIINPELEPPALQSVPVVREFLEVFPDDLPGLPPERIIDFGIDLMPGTQPISIPSYRMAL
uniref:Uncharacterized protein LOC104244901 n=1 Tax=Nicotiana sylvestris TaxID=4096 RepID=A0A1U7YHK2_NICSY|nr:PREDICTED: uncharacterized protein LOC104244901 [Nicotiana sylvestris]